MFIMKKHFLLFIVLFFSAVHSTVHAQQAALRSSNPNIGRQFVSAADYDKLPANQQSLMLANPDKFSVEGISPQVIPTVTFNQLASNRQAHIQANPQQYRLVNTVPSQAISSSDFDKMSHDKRAYILANLDYFFINNKNTTITNSSLTNISRSEFDSMPADKQAYINANSNHYNIID